MNAIVVLAIVVLGVPNFCQFMQWLMDQLDKQKVGSDYWEKRLIQAKQQTQEAEQQVAKLTQKKPN